MTELKRWQQAVAPPDFAMLLRAARNERPSAASLQRALAAVGIVGATTFVANSAAGAAGSLGTAAGKGLLGVVAKFTVLGALSGGVLVTTVAVVTHHRAVVVQPNSNATASHPRSVVSNPAFVEAPLPSEPQTGYRGIEPSAAASEKPSGATQLFVKPNDSRKPRLQRDEPSPSTTVNRAEGDNILWEEMALVDTARARMQSGNAAEALRNARAYMQRFRAGRFAPEALYLMMRAGQQLGQQDTATGAARAIIERFPASPQARRARKFLNIP